MATDLLRTEAPEDRSQAAFAAASGRFENLHDGLLLNLAGFSSNSAIIFAPIPDDILARIPGLSYLCFLWLERASRCFKMSVLAEVPTVAANQPGASVFQLAWHEREKFAHSNYLSGLATAHMQSSRCLWSEKGVQLRHRVSNPSFIAFK